MPSSPDHAEPTLPASTSALPVEVPAPGEPLAQQQQPAPQRVSLQLRLIGATALLLFTVLAMVVVIAYLMRAWRRQISGPLPPTRLDPDAWARNSLAPKRDASDDKAL